MPADANAAVLAGRYRVLRPLGAGGMATVFLCADERLGREVAVKRLHAASPEDAARRFAREARLGAGLNHENLVTIYDTAADDEGVLIVMEHVPGGTLRDALRRGPLPPRVVAGVVRDVAAGLDHAHAHGVIHRDVKPANVLLRDDGVAKLVDLGIAVARDETRITVSGTVLGTAAYMAPEQLEGEPATPATDVYALAAVAYEALAGRRARTGKTALEIAHQLATEPPPDLRAVRPDLSDDAADALRDAMQRDPARRPASAGELARMLDGGLEETRTRRLLRGDDAPRSPARRDTSPPRRAAQCSADGPGRNAPPSRRGLALALGGVALLVAAAVVAIVLSSGGGEQGGSSVAEQPAEQGGAAEDGAARPPADESAQGGAAQQPADESAPPQDAPAEAPSYPVPEPTGADPERASQLNADGYALLQEGRFDEAIPRLEEAVRLAPPDSLDPYAYALFNLGSALRQAGRPQDAVGVLERRLRVPDQQQAVREELDLAKQAAPG